MRAAAAGNHSFQTLRVGRLTELVGLDLMLHNDDPARYEDDDEMEATVGHAGTQKPTAREHQQTFRQIN